MSPYYDEGGITIWHGDCREVLPIVAQPATVDLLLTDPPYGVSERTNRGANGRSNLAAALDFPPVHGDDAPFDPTHLLGYRRTVLFGANHYADRLPPSATWLVWDKLDGLTPHRLVGFDDNADVELAWSNIGGPARLVSHRWKGMLKSSERAEPRVHPTQKPIRLMSQIIAWATEPGALVVDPYLGSGSTLRAAKDLGRRAVGVEIEERYCEVAAKRLGQEVLALDGVA